MLAMQDADLPHLGQPGVKCLAHGHFDRKDQSANPVNNERPTLPPKSQTNS